MNLTRTSSPSWSRYRLSPARPSPIATSLELILAGALFTVATQTGGWARLAVGLIILGWAKSEAGTVLSEEIVAIRGLGLQLTTTKGFQLNLPAWPALSTLIFQPALPSHSPQTGPNSSSSSDPTPPLTLTFPTSTSTTFVPLSSIGDLIINEGVYGWRIIYYLAVLTWSPAQGGAQAGPTDAKLVVVFPELLPRLAEVREVWQGVRATLFDELGEDDQFD